MSEQEQQELNEIISTFDTHPTFSMADLTEDVLVTIFSFLEQNELLKASCTNKHWYQTSKRDELWYEPLKRLKKYEKQVELNEIYQSKIQRIHTYRLKVQGVPLIPPPLFDGEIVINEKCDYRKHYMELFKKIKDERRQRLRREKIDKRNRTIGEYLHQKTKLVSIVFSSLIYICFFIGFLLRSIAHEKVVKIFTTDLRFIPFIPFWGAFILGWLLIGFFIIKWHFDKPRTYGDLPIILILSFFIFLFNAFFLLFFLNDGVFPINTTDPNKHRGVISYHFVFIPLDIVIFVLFILILIAMVGLLVENCRSPHSDT